MALEVTWNCSLFQAIQRAHGSLSSAEVSFTSGELLLANINRSPTAYAANPIEERSLYKDDVDKTMQVLRIHEQLPGAQAGQAEAHSSRTGTGGLAESAGHAEGGWKGSNATSTGRGLISWFAVHCTSMNNTNPFVSGEKTAGQAVLAVAGLHLDGVCAACVAVPLFYPAQRLCVC
jgi:neutral ceramidase